MIIFCEEVMFQLFLLNDYMKYPLDVKNLSKNYAIYGFCFLACIDIELEKLPGPQQVQWKDLCGCRVTIVRASC